MEHIECAKEKKQLNYVIDTMYLCQEGSVPHDWSDSRVRLDVLVRFVGCCLQNGG